MISQPVPPLTRSEPHFYVTGGTLRRDAPSYVARQADEDLYRGLTEGSFCYVLTPRQMGKSSLMVRTAARLRETGVTVAVLDLTAIGQNLTAEQWYEGLLGELGHQLNLEDQLEDFWLAQERLGPLQRWMRAIREIVLPLRSGRLVLFIDEIDTVRSLSFSTDEFFAGIREFYSRRTEDSEMSRLTFCLLGVVTPSDLVRDTRTTPFNIGERIELNDFSETEAAPLARGLGREEVTDAKLLQRILYWTGGHPYLTQRLCLAVSEDATVDDAAGVDRLCEELFLSHRAQERDDNLLFVRERLLRSEANLAALMDLYGQVRKGKRVRDQEANSFVGVLRLSGVVRVTDGHLEVRNRIYQRVFDSAWVKANMPDAELQRQRAAYWKGVIRTAAVAGVALAVTSLLALYASAQRNRAVEREEDYRRLLYAAQMTLAQQALQDTDIQRVEELLRSQMPRGSQRDLRSFEWLYLWRFLQIRSLRHQSTVSSFAFSPDGGRIASGSWDSSVRLWEVASGQELLTLNGHSASVNSLAFSPDGKRIASGSLDGSIRLWDVATGQELLILKTHVDSLAFSPDGKRIAYGSRDHSVKVWDVAIRQDVLALKGHSASVNSVAFSPDGKRIASGCRDHSGKLWDVATGQEIRTLKGSVNSVAFSPDGKRIAAGGYDSRVRLWDVATGQEILTLEGRLGSTQSIAFSPDGKRILSGGNNTIMLWDVATRQELRSLKGHSAFIISVGFSPDGKSIASGGGNTIKLWDVAPGPELLTNSGLVYSIAFSPDGKRIASGSEDHLVKLWDVSTRKELQTLKGHSEAIHSVAFSPDGKRIASGGDDLTLKLWDASTGQEMLTLKGHSASVLSVVFSPDGQKIASGSYDNSVRLWDVATGQELVKLRGSAAVAFSPDGTRIATGGDDSTVTLSDVATGQELLTLAARFISVKSVVFSPDGKRIASGGEDGTIMLWDLATRKELATLKGLSGIITSIAFSQDGKRIASGGNDSTIKLWDVETGQELLTLKGRSEFFNSLAFSPDGRWLAVADKDLITLRQAATKEEVAAQLKSEASR